MAITLFKMKELLVIIELNLINIKIINYNKEYLSLLKSININFKIIVLIKKIQYR